MTLNSEYVTIQYWDGRWKTFWNGGLATEKEQRGMIATLQRLGYKVRVR